MSESTLDRRKFLKLATVIPTVVVASSALSACDSTSGNNNNNNNNGTSGITVSGNTITLDLTKSDTSKLTSAGSFLMISSAKVIVVNDAGTIRALTMVCTHEQCDVNGVTNNQIVCNCHNSKFKLDGSVVQGPATTPLKTYSSTKNGDIVTITKA